MKSPFKIYDRRLVPDQMALGAFCVFPRMMAVNALKTVVICMGPMGKGDRRLPVADLGKDHDVFHGIERPAHDKKRKDSNRGTIASVMEFFHYNTFILKKWQRTWKHHPLV